MTAEFGTTGISPREFCVLSHALTGETTQIRLAKLSALDKTTMVATRDRLGRSAAVTGRTPGEDHTIELTYLSKDKSSCLG